MGLEVQVVKLLLTQEAVFSQEFWKRKHFIFFDFLCRSDMDRVTVDNRELEDYVWVFPGQALNMNLESFSRRVLEKYLGTN